MPTVAFWSTEDSAQLCTTATVAAVAMMLTIRGKYRTLLTQTHYSDMSLEIDIAGYHFVFSQWREMDVYRNGEFTTLSMAYEKGWLTDEGLAKLLAYYKQLKPYLYEW